ncbi:MAG: extracellular solute-binding protein [Vicinamibacterales bacterium]
MGVNVSRRVRRFRHSLALLLVALLLIPLLAGCGGDDDDDPTATAAVGSEPTTSASPAATTASADASPTTAGAADEEVTLRLGVSMTPAELETFEAGIDAISAAHPNWTIELEQTPQEGIIERMNTQIAGDDLPDVVMVQGLMAQQWIRQDVFLDLSTFAGEEAFAVDDFWSGAVDQFRWNDGLYGIPNTVAPDVVYYNKAMFDAAGLDYPTDDWTFDDLREMAIALTLDGNGNNPTDADFDPDNVVQWGFNLTPNNIWSRHLLLPFGADPCVNEDCTEVNFASPEVVGALEWWAGLSRDDYAAPYDPYSGNQTGVPGDPFSAGLAAMGYNGFFLVGQLNATGTMEYDIVQPPTGPDGSRHTTLSTNGWAIPATSEHQDAAWALITELTAPEFLETYWAQPGHAVPARTSASQAILNPSAAPENQEAILAALEYAQVFRPFTASAFEVYAATTETFVAIMKGDLTAEEGAEQIDTTANEVLAKDRE